jgi:hypothetical protein
MRNLRFKKPSPALVIAVIALFIGLSGAAYAGNKIGTNGIKGKAVTTGKLSGKAVTKGKLAGKSVATGKLADQAVTELKLGDQSVTTSKLGDQSVTESKLGDGSVTSSKQGDGSVTSSKLGDGSVTSSKLGEITKVEKTSPPAAVPQINATADCPAGTKVTSGGFKVTSATDPNNPPIPTGDKRSNNGWETTAVAQAPGDTVTAYAYCLESSS